MTVTERTVALEAAVLELLARVQRLEAEGADRRFATLVGDIYRPGSIPEIDLSPGDTGRMALYHEV